MRILPISFSPQMVLGLVREIEQPGTGKTQTRRLLTPPRGFVDEDDPHHWDVSFWNSTGVSFVCWPHDEAETRKVPHRYLVGDHLYVREAWRTHAHLDRFPPSVLPVDTPVFYEAYLGGDARAATGKFRQGMHQPRWASRITVTVTDVRVQRLQAIGADDCRAEGHQIERERSTNQEVHDDAARDWYRDLWDSLNADRASWDANPWVTAYTLVPHLINVDKYLEGGTA